MKFIRHGLTTAVVACSITALTAIGVSRDSNAQEAGLVAPSPENHRFSKSTLRVEPETATPETDEGSQMGSVVWRTGKRSFLMLYDYGKGLTASFWVGIERQGPLEMDPRFTIPKYLGHNGWIALDLAQGASTRELREFIQMSFRHFATRRAIAALDATTLVA